MTISTIEKLDEHRARYICGKAGMNPDKHWHQYLDYAVGLRLGDAKAGVQDVPVEPTEAMADAADVWDGYASNATYGIHYGAMIPASPFYTDPEAKDASNS